MKTAARPKILEKHVQRAIIEYLRATGWYVVVNVTYSQTCFATKGISDLVAVKKKLHVGEFSGFLCARTIWLEVKAPGGKQSENQKEFQAEIERQSGEYLLADSLDAVIGYLGEERMK